MYRQDAKVNQDINAVRRVFPLDEGWVIIRARENQKHLFREAGDIMSPDVLRVQRDLTNQLLQDPDVDRVISVVPDIIEPFSRMFHYGVPKYRTIPATTDDAFALFTLFVAGTAPGESDAWLSLTNNDAVMRVLLRDHTYSTLTRIQEQLADFVKGREHTDPAFEKIEVLYLGGIAGLYASANDVLYEIDFLNITFVLGVVFLFLSLIHI